MTTQTNVDTKNRHLPTITSEEEREPISRDAIEELPVKDVSELERKAAIYKGVHPYILQDKGFILIIVFAILLIALYALDVIFINLGLKNSSLLNAMFDFLKYVTSTLVGFVFSAQAFKQQT